MAESDFGMGYALGADSGGNNNGGMFGGDGWLGLILFAMIFGNGGWGGMGGGYMMNGALTRAELYDGFAMQNIDSAVRGVQQGICDSTYALNNSLMSGFHGVDNAICTLGYQTQQSFNSIGHQISDCCCQTQRAIDSVRYDMATQSCDTRRAVADAARDIIDSQNCNTRSILDFMIQEKLSSKDARIASLEGQLSQANQNAVIGARIDAATAEILRRSGHDCPSAAYIVNPPTPVTFNGNGCGSAFGGSCCGC